MGTRDDAPRTYDEIVRHTVPQPDGSFQSEPAPSEDEQRRDRQLRRAISEALIAHAIDTLGFEVVRGRVILEGWVRDHATALRVVKIIAEAAPDAVIDDQMRLLRSDATSY
jgi:hypothetical protein